MLQSRISCDILVNLSKYTCFVFRARTPSMQRPCTFYPSSRKPSNAIRNRETQREREKRERERHREKDIQRERDADYAVSNSRYSGVARGGQVGASAPGRQGLGAPK